jgi:hypothetical protein
MKIIITENQNYILRRLNQFIKIVEDKIGEFELEDNSHWDNPWWCSSIYTPEKFLEIITDRSIDDFIENNWDFFHDDSDRGGSDMDISILNRIVEENYGYHIKNLWVKRCGK